MMQRTYWNEAVQEAWDLLFAEVHQGSIPSPTTLANECDRPYMMNALRKVADELESWNTLEEREFALGMMVEKLLQQPNNRLAERLIIQCHQDWVSEGGLEYGVLNPIRHLAEAYCDRPMEKEYARVQAVGSSMLTRIPTIARSAALIPWHESRASAIKVDGSPIVSPAPDVKSYVPYRSKSRDGKLFQIPGMHQAESMILRVLSNLPHETDRRTPLPADLYFILTLGCALQRPVYLHIDDVARWLIGLSDASKLDYRSFKTLRERAWSALDWARSWVQLPDGNYKALVDINTVGQNSGNFEMRTYGWELATGQAKSWRLTGGAVNVVARTKSPGSGRGNDYGLFSQIIAGMEDIISSSPGIGKSRTPHLLVRSDVSGAGQPITIDYPTLLARSGFAFDATDDLQWTKTRNTWRRLSERLQRNGYVVRKISDEAQAGDTVEVVDFIKGTRGNPGSVKFRASARFVEAQRKAQSPEEGGFDSVPLKSILPSGI